MRKLAIALLLGAACHLSQAQYANPCQRAQMVSAPVNLTASGTVITGLSGHKVYICHLGIISATSQNVALVEGTGTTCGTSTAGMAGGNTAATGWNFGTNGGIVEGDGGWQIAATATAGDNVCLLSSSTGQISGVIDYVIL